MPILLFRLDKISFLNSLLQNSYKYSFLEKHLKSRKVDNSCILGFLIVVVLKLSKFIFNLSKNIISFFKFFW